VNYLSDDTTFLMISADLDPTGIKIPLLKNDMVEGHWMNLKFFFDMDVGRIVAYVDDEETGVSPFDMNLSTPVDLVFGFFKQNHTDVPAASIRNIRVVNKSSSKPKLIHHWKLAETLGDRVLDEITGKYGFQKYGKWIAGEHLYWEPVGTILVPFIQGDVLGFVEGLVGSEFHRFFVNDTLFEYSYDERKFRKISFTNSPPFEKPAIAYDTKHKTYFSFHGGGGSSVSVLDTTDWSWSPVQNSGTNDHYYASVRFTDRNGDFYMIGGYGNYRYKDIIQKYNTQNNSWDTLTVSGDTFPHRSGGIVTWGFGRNDVYLFTPTGNETGDQKDGIKHYGEIWHFDMDKLKLSLVYDMSDQRDKYNFRNHILLSDTVNKLIYFMNEAKNSPVNQLYMTTSEFSPIVPVGAPLKGIVMEDCAYDHKAGIIYGFMRNDNKDGVPKTLYKIKTPILPAELSQLNELNSVSQARKIAVIILLVLAGIVVLIYKGVTHKKIKPIFISPKWEVLLKQIPDDNFKVRVIGQFTVFDKNDKDITSTFTPKLRDLFLDILFHSGFDNQNHSGITHEELNVHLWKGNHVSHNTFSVTLKRLRNLLFSVPSLKIVTHDGVISIECKNIGDCDFILYKQLTQYFKTEKEYHKEIIHEFCKLTSSGELLPGFTNRWIDPIKSKISNDVVNTLLNIAVNYDFGDDYQLQVIVGETILKWDKLEQKGLELALFGLKKLGKYGRIKETFASFSDSFKNTFDTDFPHSIKSLSSM
jgi:hypothetical protein